MRTAREVVELYNLELWNNARFELADEIIADTMVRHEVGASRILTRAEARQRVEDTWAMFDNLTFVLNTVIASDDGEHVSIVYDSTLTNKDGSTIEIASIEVFKVVEGRITDVWNCGYGQGVWA
ncbi:ester cyclase [[Mycobacterium] burgundiense]|uniref:Ester cyclase n=1 Tax=[Mycobacterium] burgundiense TaxID=3064286 RepID=A0ABM9LBI8_9MYCO|nr:ester cyclase [Mycolicibacterium sp. MU0053]CAJ1496138.1 ester cyclase [Mycolicibacterium sp. MU0053]